MSAVLHRRWTVVLLGIVGIVVGGLGDRHWLGLKGGQCIRPQDVHAALAFTTDEEINIRVYRAASPAVVNITTTAVAYDFFLNPVPKEGTGSGAIIDPFGLHSHQLSRHRRRAPAGGDARRCQQVAGTTNRGRPEQRSSGDQDRCSSREAQRHAPGRLL